MLPKVSPDINYTLPMPVRNLKPGGYAEFFDYNFVLESDDGTLKKDHEMKINCDLVCQAAARIGQDAYPGAKLKKWAEEAGFVNIKEHVFKVPFGPWARDPRLVRPSFFFYNVLAFTDSYTEGSRRLESTPGYGRDRRLDYGHADSRARMVPRGSTGASC